MSLAGTANSYHVTADALDLARLELSDAINRARDDGWSWPRIAEQCDLTISQVRRIGSLTA